ncbi:outer membrane receptor protein involved in Fe transport [Litorivivens lipolytica]|uniref:Outer membrane receptor protein involved in Fe transport n=1 Tax=Litorivivens lipolytica TaxID=1524264 RepID=A0A7W4W797_9GAMM|nr:TonB-dependent receptor [Litorivivens lipolytica]MBB3048224.1 outer membrane receptor protein involved in Fe transport [Litorivivens lipolytica]
MEKAFRNLSLMAALSLPATELLAASGILEEVLVTARKRSESMQDIPIAVSAISGEDLRERGIANTAELTKSVPSLEIRKGQANQIYIRGIGERTGFARVDPTVGVYLDDLFLPRSDGQLLDTVDIASIQVLRGPQGTLFGKNTTGGAMVVSLRKPDDSYEAYVEAGIGSYNHRRFKAGFNLPISDTFFTRTAVHVTKDDGYFENIGQNGRGNPSNDRQAFLFQTRWEPSATFSLDTQTFVGKIRENLAGINCSIPTKDSLYYEGLWVAHPGDTDPSNLRAFEENCNANSRDRLGDLTANQGPNPRLEKDLDTYLFGTTATWELSESLQLKTIVGLRSEKEGPIQASDPDGGPALWSSYINTEDSDRRSYSLEFQLNGSNADQSLRYTVGLFGMRETNSENFTVSNVFRGLDSTTLGDLAAGRTPSRPPPTGTVPLVGFIGSPLVISDFALENETTALFAQVSYDVTAQLELTLGYRFTNEKRHSELDTLEADMAAIESRLLASNAFGAPRSAGAFGAGAGGFYPYLGPLRWLDDPVSIAAALFPDADGDALLDYPIDPNSARSDEREETFRQSTPMVSLSYHLSDDWLQDSFFSSALLYATWSRGFKSGFFEPRGIDGLQRIEPEVVTNHEIGFKVDAFERSLRLNGAIYMMDYEDQQLIAVGSDSAQNVAVVFGNAGQSRITGFELEMLWLPSPALQINASFSANDYEFLEFNELDLAAALTGQEKVVDRTDETFPVSPERSGALGIQYQWAPDWGAITARLDASYKSDIFYGFDPGSYRAFERSTESAGQPAYTLLDARFTWQNPEGDTTVSLWLKNLADERYRIGVVAVADSSGTFNESWGEPRMMGLDIRYSF